LAEYVDGNSRRINARCAESKINARVATAAMAANGVLARVADVASSDLLAFIDVDEQAGVKVAEGATHFLAPRKRRWPLSPNDTQDRSDVDCLVRASHNELWSMRRHGSPPGSNEEFAEGRSRSGSLANSGSEETYWATLDHPCGSIGLPVRH